MREIFFLGVDIGTSSSKGVLVDPAGRVVASHALPHSLQMPQPGFFEHEADQVWWHDFVTLTRSLLQSTGIDPHQIAGIGVSGIGPCVLPIDEEGKPLHPGILYGIDTRAEAEIAHLENVIGRDEIFRTTAMHLSSQAAGPKLLWIRNHEPDIFARARWFLTSQAYLVFRLTGLPSIDVYTAGYYLPLYDVFRREWNAEAARWIVPIKKLPRVYWTAEVVGGVTPGATEETGLAEGTPVVAGTADAAAEALSAGMEYVGDLFLMLGSSIFFILKTRSLVRTPRFWSSNFLQAGEFAFAGGTSTSGSLTQWFREQFAPIELAAERSGGPNAYAALEGLAASSPIGANGLVALPYFAGERTPLHDAKARGLLFGLTLKHTRGDIYRAILEGVAYGIRHNLETMAEEGVQAQRILVSGGGVQNRLWLQVIADVCGIDLVLPDQTAGASYGDAFLASVGAGLHRDLSEIGRWVHPQETIHPDSKNHATYEPFYQIYRQLYPANRSLMHRLAEIEPGEKKDE
jgi:xylulokinase